MTSLYLIYSTHKLHTISRIHKQICRNNNQYVLAHLKSDLYLWVASNSMRVGKLSSIQQQLSQIKNVVFAWLNTETLVVYCPRINRITCASFDPRYCTWLIALGAKQLRPESQGQVIIYLFWKTSKYSPIDT
jgi:hypothetical protein